MNKTNFAKGNEYFRSEKYEKAIEFYQQSLQKKPFTYCYENLSKAFFYNKDLVNAREALKKAYESSQDEKRKELLRNSPLFNYLKVSLDFNEVQSKLKLPVSDLKNKLWGGFSKQAKSDLIAKLDDEKISKKEKVEAAYVISRWYAAHNDWHESVSFIKEISKYDLKYFRRKKTKLLLIEGYIATGQYQQAQGMIDYVVNQRVEGDFLCALNNLLASQDPANATKHRLEALNRIYINAQLAPIKLIDEKKGLIFGNIDYRLIDKNIESKLKISILVPVYNTEKFVDVAILSLLNQTWQNIEIIAVEDCSSDNSWEKLEALAKRDSRLKIYKNEKNLGAYPTRNKALSLANGDYITVHDSDDWSHPQMLEVQMQAMINNPQIKISCSAMTRVYPNLRFILRPQRENLEYIHRSYPSVLLKHEDLKHLGEWDGISANADDELVQRARVLWGVETVVDILKDVPLSYFLVHENSLTQQKGTSLNTLTFGIRKEYSRQASYWRKNKKNSQDLNVKRISLKEPFPIPQGLAPKNWKQNTYYDLVLVSDLGLLGGTRRCNEGYIEAASAMGWRIGIFHWPRYDLKTVEIADEYMEMSCRENIDILVPEDEIKSKMVIIHHPPILNYGIDAVPKIKTKKVGILVNQSPMQLWSQQPYYYHAQQAEDLVEKLFGEKPVWIPISPRVTQTLELAGGYNNLHSEVWYPPYNGQLPEELPNLPAGFGTERKIKLGRHARNHWTKWPNNANELREAYCADSEVIDVHLLGGAETPQKILGNLPNNWRVLEFDTVNVKSFVDNLDFFIHYTHPDYIEEFGRNIMEAMAAGRVVILPPEYRDVFGDAATYCDAEDVQKIIFEYWDSTELYKDQASKGYKYVKTCSSLENVAERMRRFLLMDVKNDFKKKL